MDTSTIIAELNGIRVTNTAIEELDTDGTALITVPREDVLALRVAYGFVSERALVVFALGIGLTFLGVWLGSALLRTLLSPEDHLGRRAAYLITSSVMTSGLGLWLARHGLLRGPFLLVSLQTENRKLAFRTGTSLDMARELSLAVQRSATWAPLVRPPSA